MPWIWRCPIPLLWNVVDGVAGESHRESHLANPIWYISTDRASFLKPPNDVFDSACIVDSIYWYWWRLHLLTRLKKVFFDEGWRRGRAVSPMLSPTKENYLWTVNVVSNNPEARTEQSKERVHRGDYHNITESIMLSDWRHNGSADQSMPRYYRTASITRIIQR